jgi:hypothetical protein
MRIQSNGDVVLVTDLIQDSGDNIGNISNNSGHSVFLTVNLPGAEYGVTIVKPSGNIVQSHRPLLTTDITSYHNPARPSVSFQYPAASTLNTYLLDEVMISRRNN